jgi:hypothetical protein
MQTDAVDDLIARQVGTTSEGENVHDIAALRQ